MPSSSVSFRISRQTEDLAETLHALSQRLVAMEQRLGSVEVQLAALRNQPREDPAEQERLAPIEDNIARLLLDCRQLLAEATTDGGESDTQGSATPEPGACGDAEPLNPDGPESFIPEQEHTAA